MVEPKWFERGMRESIQIRINSPTLNKDAGRYNLPPVWNNTLKKLGKGGAGHQVSGPPTRRCSLTTSTVLPIPPGGCLMKHAESVQKLTK